MDLSKIKKFRILNDLTQEELANACYVSRSTISNWEAGRRKPDIESLLILSKLFNVSLEELLDDQSCEEEKKKKTYDCFNFLRKEKIISFSNVITITSIFLTIVLLLMTLVSTIDKRLNRFEKTHLYDIEIVCLNINTISNSIDTYYFNELNVKTEAKERSFKICDLMIDQSKFFKYQYCHDLICILDISIQYNDYNLKSKFDERKFVKSNKGNNLICFLEKDNLPFITKPGIYDFTLTIYENIYYIGAYLK